ncbi:MAG TPA: DUF3971 domain-containing protein [Aestuariivirgaceae bacterium]|nr:DUF3971 domain-containing protein [Aestuariivirgaceae bacterium]
MPRTVRKFTLLVALALLCIFATLAIAFMVRLSQGPVTLTFLTGPIQSAINSNLGDYRVEVAGAIIERDQLSGQPRLRLRNLVLKNIQGEVIAQAPRAAIGIDGTAVLAGRIVPRQLELIDAHIQIQRGLDGNFSLGFGTARSPDEAADQASAPEPPAEPSTPGAALREFFDRELLSGSRGQTAVSTLETVKISNASLALFDEFNQANWSAPSANLLFRRMPYGFALFADVRIATGGEPWRSELVANYRAASRTFAISARIFDLVPADLSSKVFALHRLAQVRFPLSGQAELQLTDEGEITKASAELTAAAGIIGFPDYISEPIAISEGLLRFDLEPETGAFILHDSTVTVQGGVTGVQGRIEPRRADDGRLTAMAVSLNVSDFVMTPENRKASRIAFDRVELKGIASVVENRFDIEDFILQTGNAGVRLRGSFEGGGSAIGVRISGVVRDLPVEVVKKLWPPIVAPNTKKWLDANVSKGIVPDGLFQINVPSETIAGVFEGKPIPADQIDVTFSLKGVETGYFGALPPITDADGKGQLSGNRLEITLAKGRVTVPSGDVLTLTSGSLVTTPLTAPIVPTVIEVKAEAKAESVLELLDQDPLNYPSQAKLSPASMSGATNVNLRVELKAPRGKKPIVTIAADAAVKDVHLKGVIQQADITGGNMTFSYAAGRVGAKGVVQLEGVPAAVSWSRAVGKNVDSDQHISLEAELDDAERAKLGLSTAGFVRGPVRIKLAAAEAGGKITTAAVEADLAKAQLHVDAMRWWREAGANSKATFNLDASDPERRVIDNIVVSGEDLSIKGALVLGKQGEVVSADFPNTILDDNNQFSLKIRRRDGVVAATISGQEFDARSLISGTFKPTAAPPSPSESVMTPVTVDASFGKAHAHRGEAIINATAKLAVIGNYVQSADISGTFLGGAPVTLKIAANDAAGRDMRFVARDAGAALRAANLYSKVSGGQIELFAQLGSVADSSIQRGQLVVRNFEVRDETALSDIDRPTTSRGQKTGPRREALTFTRFTMPFSTDKTFVRIGDSLLKGPDMGASLQGVIRKRDGAIDIGGTIIPAYALNAALSDIPLLGEILTGGKGQGVFGLNFALRGTMSQPQFVVNPVSAIAPGFLRRLFDIGGNYPEPGQKKRRAEPSN